MGHRLFPTDLAEREWVEFEAQGFSAPVPGVVFRDGSVERGVPMGALGTGCIVLGTDGTLDYYSTIFNAFLERTHLAGQAPKDSTRTRNYDWMQGPRSNVPDMKLPFLGLAVGGKSWALTLQDVDGVENAGQIHYWGHYPVADLEYETGAPVSVGLRAWTPFYPGDEGLFFVNESLLSCPQQCCIANDSGAEWTVDIFFPDLARNKLRAFRHYQRRSGQTPSTLGTGTEPDQPWSDQQLPFDGQVYIHLVQRLWQVTGDRALLEEFYDSVKAGVRFMRTVDKDGDGIPDVKGSNQFYDNWPEMMGAAVHVATYWLATLRMVERMALEMEDIAFVDECRGWFRQASESIETVLWNEQAGSYLLYHHPETGTKSDSVLPNQLNGQGYADVYGLPRVLPEERARRVIETVWRLNVGSTPHGVMVAVRPGGGADATSTGTHSSCMIPADPSITPAMVLIYGGDRERGEELMRRAGRRMVIDLQRPWDMPCGLDADGNHLFGLEYYQNTMLWALPIALLGQDVRTFSAPRGLRDRIVTAASP